MCVIVVCACVCVCVCHCCVCLCVICCWSRVLRRDLHINTPLDTPRCLCVCVCVCVRVRVCVCADSLTCIWCDQTQPCCVVLQYYCTIRGSVTCSTAVTDLLFFVPWCVYCRPFYLSFSVWRGEFTYVWSRHVEGPHICILTTLQHYELWGCWTWVFSDLITSGNLWSDLTSYKYKMFDLLEAELTKRPK